MEDRIKPVRLNEDYSLESNDETDPRAMPARIFDSHVNSGDSKPSSLPRQLRLIAENITPRTKKAIMSILALLLLLCVIAAVIMLALFSPEAQGPDPETIYYYIQAEKVIWDFAPTHKDLLRGGYLPMEMKKSDMPPDTPKKRVKRGSGKKGGKTDESGSSGSGSGSDDTMQMGDGPWRSTKWAKAVYREYTDDTFTVPIERSEEEAHLGILGPVIRAQVGDTIVVVFKNTLDFPASIHPHGVLYKKDSEGASYLDTEEELETGDVMSQSKLQTRGVIGTNETYTYTWEVPERAGPLSTGPSSIVWLYHSHANEVKDVMTGLVGPLIITGRGAATKDRRPRDVDNEWILYSIIFDEKENHYVEENTPKQSDNHSGMEGMEGMEGMTMSKNSTISKMDLDDAFIVHSLNGYLSSNIPIFKGNEGDLSRWYMMGLGGEMDIHTIHTHGHTMVDQMSRVDTTILLPGVTVTADMVLDNPGVWLYHCHTSSHATRMTGLYQVNER